MVCCLYWSWCHIRGPLGGDWPLTSADLSPGHWRLVTGHWRSLVLHMGLCTLGRDDTLTTAMRLTEALIRGRGCQPGRHRPQPGPGLYSRQRPGKPQQSRQPPAASQQQRTNKLRIQVFMQILVWLNFTFQLRMTI